MKPSQWASLLSVGKMLLVRNRQTDERTFAGAQFFDTSFGRLCVFQGGSRDASDVAERYWNQVAVFAAFSCFVVEGQQGMVVEVRPGGSGVSVLDLVKPLGGGGHEKAGGFKLSKVRENPWTEVLVALTRGFITSDANPIPGYIREITVPPIVLVVDEEN